MMWTVLYVIAGDKKEYNDFVQRSVESGKYPDTNFMWVSGIEVFRGIVNPNGICIGTWKDRLDIDIILNNLMVVCREPSKFRQVIQLKQIYRTHLKNHENSIVLRQSP